ncbi:hypothetical protein ACFOW1_06660 [Parasediminibacterium paludis]|uniref:Uncharacterized protein n=1 Tax=Parasediminibacterium paludis TaxID=908966 RepID=A0ABV8PX88_9BACT
MPWFNHIVIGLCAMLLAFLLWKEVTRPLRARLWWRIVATCIAMIAFAGMAIDIRYQISNTDSNNKQSLLLTDGYNKDSITAFIKAHPNTDTISVSEAATATNLHVFGNGLTLADLQLLKSNTIQFHPTNNTNGITAINCPHTIHSGEALQVEGRYNNTSKLPVTIYLAAFGNSLDTVTIAPLQEQTFHLQTIPKHSGRAVYSVIAMAQKDTLENNALPFEVLPMQPLRVLVLAATPNFEHKFLKNWLYENNYAVASRTTVSKAKYATSFLNTKSIILDNITGSALSNFDLLIADDDVLNSLSANELAAIKTAIVQQGLGLVVQRDSSNDASKFYQQPFTINTTSNSEQKTLRLQFNNTKEQLLVAQPTYLKANASTQTLITDDSTKIMAAVSILGMGKIVATTLNATYSLVLQNKPASYYQLWSLLLQKAAKQTNEDINVKVKPNIIYPYQQATIQIESTTQPLGVMVQQTALALQQQVQLPYIRSASYWPKQTGWQRIETANGFSRYWYVFQPKDWASVQATDNMLATKMYAATHKYPLNKESVTATKQTATLPKIYCFLFFLLAMAALWLERKL